MDSKQLELNVIKAEQTLLAPFDLQRKDLSKIFGEVMTRSVDYSDLYFQYAKSEGWSLEEGIVKAGNFSIDQGVGIRAVSGEKTAFAHSDDLSMKALRNAARATRAIGGQGNQVEKAKLEVPRKPLALYDDCDPLMNMADTEKVGLIQKLESIAPVLH